MRDYTGCNPGRRTSSFTRQPPDGAEIIGAQLVPSDLLHIGKDLRCPFQYSRPRQQDSANPFTPTRTLGYRAPYQKQTPGSSEYLGLTMRVMRSSFEILLLVACDNPTTPREYVTLAKPSSALQVQFLQTQFGRIEPVRESLREASLIHSPREPPLREF